MKRNLLYIIKKYLHSFKLVTVIRAADQSGITFVERFSAKDSSVYTGLLVVTKTK